jgi:hypothetical protein
MDTMEQSMIKSLTPLDVDRLKRAAKRLARIAEIPLHEAQAQVAKREGFCSWELLQRSVPRQIVKAMRPLDLKLKPDADCSIGSALAAHIKATCLEFIQGLDEAKVFQACWSGSIWISLDDVEDGNVTECSFGVYGRIFDGVSRQAAHADGMALLIDLEGLAERFVLHDDVDDYGRPVVPDGTRLMYNVDVGRAELAEEADNSLDSDVDGLQYALLDRRSQY